MSLLQVSLLQVSLLTIDTDRRDRRVKRAGRSVSHLASASVTPHFLNKSRGCWVKLVDKRGRGVRPKAALLRSQAVENACFGSKVSVARHGLARPGTGHGTGEMKKIPHFMRLGTVSRVFHEQGPPPCLSVAFWRSPACLAEAAERRRAPRPFTVTAHRSPARPAPDRTHRHLSGV